MSWSHLNHYWRALKAAANTPIANGRKRKAAELVKEEDESIRPEEEERDAKKRKETNDAESEERLNQGYEEILEAMAQEKSTKTTPPVGLGIMMEINWSQSSVTPPESVSSANDASPVTSPVLLPVTSSDYSPTPEQACFACPAR